MSEVLGGEVVEQCRGCGNYTTTDGSTPERCKIWNSPETKWRLGVCSHATHIEKEIKPESNTKIRVGQQKQGKTKKK